MRISCQRGFKASGTHGSDLAEADMSRQRLQWPQLYFMASFGANIRRKRFCFVDFTPPIDSVYCTVHSGKLCMHMVFCLLQFKSCRNGAPMETILASLASTQAFYGFFNVTQTCHGLKNVPRSPGVQGVQKFAVSCLEYVDNTIISFIALTEAPGLIIDQRHLYKEKGGGVRPVSNHHNHPGIQSIYSRIQILASQLEFKVHD